MPWPEPPPPTESTAPGRGLEERGWEEASVPGSVTGLLEAVRGCRPVGNRHDR